MEGDNNKFIFKPTTITKIGGKWTILISFVLLLFVFGVALALYSNQTSNKIVGRWIRTDTEKMYEFTKDGQFLYLSGSDGGVAATYSVDGNQLKFNFSALWAQTTVFADIKISGNQLKLSNFIDPEDWLELDDGEEWVFTKVK